MGSRRPWAPMNRLIWGVEGLANRLPGLDGLAWVGEVRYPRSHHSFPGRRLRLAPHRSMLAGSFSMPAFPDLAMAGIALIPAFPDLAMAEFVPIPESVDSMPAFSAPIPVSPHSDYPRVRGHGLRPALQRLMPLVMFRWWPPEHLGHHQPVHRPHQSQLPGEFPHSPS